VKGRRRAVFGGLFLVEVGIAALAPCTVAAQVALTISGESDARYRGGSVTDGRPAFDMAVSFDDPTGLYGGASVSGSPQPDAGLRLIGLEEYFGYAHRAAGDVVLDFGFADYQRWSYRDHEREGWLETEAYAGVRRGDVSAYIFYSPHYYASGSRTLYAQGEFQRTLWGPWRGFAHVGLLTPLGVPIWWHASGSERPDGSVGVSRSFRKVRVALAWTAAPRQAYTPFLGPAGQAVTLSAAWGF
jgi:uncharacterized protein (TIGR02001 family)